MPSIHLVTGSVKYLPFFAGESFAFASEALDMRDYEKTGKDRQEPSPLGKVAERERGRKRKSLSHRKRSPLPKGEGIGKSNFNFINKTTP